MVPETSTYFLKIVNPFIEFVLISLVVEDNQCLKGIAFITALLPKSMSLMWKYLLEYVSSLLYPDLEIKQTFTKRISQMLLVWIQSLSEETFLNLSCLGAQDETNLKLCGHHYLQSV